MSRASSSTVAPRQRSSFSTSLLDADRPPRRRLDKVAAMEPFIKIATLLPWIDWTAVVIFFGGWAGYAWFARHRANKHPSILATTNRIRREWMHQSTYRDARVIDGVIIQNLSTSPSFFASTTILIIGGLLAIL